MPSPKDLSSIHEYLQCHFAETPTLTQLSQLCGCSPCYLQRSFKNAYGLSPAEMTANLKLQRATELLAGDTMSVIDVCLEIGYQSPTTFAGWFKSHRGLSPQAYRRDSQRIYVLPLRQSQVWIPQCFATVFRADHLVQDRRGNTM